MENSNYQVGAVRSVNVTSVLFADFQLEAKAVDPLRINQGEVYAVGYHKSYWNWYNAYRKPVGALGCENWASFIDCFVAVREYKVATAPVESIRYCIYKVVKSFYYDPKEIISFLFFHMFKW